MKKIFTVLVMSVLLMACKKVQKGEPVHQPVDKDATEETVKLYNKLFALMETGTMVGHQDALAYGHGWYKENGRSDVKGVTGDYPAVIGWELGHVEIGAEYNLDSVYFSDMKQYIKDTYKRGGITTASWHGDNIVTGNTSWDCAQDTVVKTILPGGSNYDKYLTWLDRVGDFFLDLKDEEGKPIPVVFRMYHEHTGDWFWWGSTQCTPDEYKQLWMMTVDHLRNKKSVHNLLYAYSPSETKDEVEFLERYPGDEYVDIIGYDCYATGSDSTAVANYKAAMDRNLKIVTTYAQKSGKLPIVGETGMEAIPYPTYFTEAVYPVISQYKIGWVLFWRNAWEADKPQHFYAPFAGHTSAPDFVNFVEKPDVLMNKDITEE
ncbi:glycoside hydrolase family 26 protein [Dysgonomonas sp. 511]|uniref:glycoside hydrolase family 26 protein n=1 Tax=Dysgonomonas sp. 511 TaxID=2302930 RepID=UPI0013D813A2|nr:glycosyl hydrolase [Dysgonomonas sp. 511]NDV77407.1 endoglucanase [Dysgonomonas sp. 511]